MTVQEELDLEALVYVIRKLGLKHGGVELQHSLLRCSEMATLSEAIGDDLRPFIARLQRELEES